MEKREKTLHKERTLTQMEESFLITILSVFFTCIFLDQISPQASWISEYPRG